MSKCKHERFDSDEDNNGYCLHCGDTFFTIVRDQQERISALERVAERYNRLKNIAVKNTAYDRYGEGCHWTIGFFSDDSTMSFDDVVDKQAI